MTTATRRLGLIAIITLSAGACTSKDNLLYRGDASADPRTGGAGGTLLGSGGSAGTGGLGAGGMATGGIVGTGGVVGTGGLPTGTGGLLTGTGGSTVGAGGQGGGKEGTGGATAGSGGSGGGAVGTGGKGGAGQGGSAGYDAGVDAGIDAAQPECPSSVPSGACSAASTTLCYYGDDPRWFCKTSAKCTQGKWALTDPLPECTATPSSDCPATPTSARTGLCTADGGTKAVCVYATQFCKCGFTGGPEPGWTCSKNLPAECPTLRPGDGSPCTTTSGVWCTYGTSCSGNDMQCVEGKWVTLLLSC